MKAKRTVTRITSYEVNKYDLARLLLGDLGDATVSVDAKPGEAKVTITIRDDFNGEAELD